MTRKDYKLLARALWGSAIVNADGTLMNDEKLLWARRQWETTVRQVANALAKDNPRFDHAKFEAACTNNAEGM